MWIVLSSGFLFCGNNSWTTNNKSHHTLHIYIVTPRPEKVYGTGNCRGRICAPSEIVIFLGVVVQDEMLK